MGWTAFNSCRHFFERKIGRQGFFEKKAGTHLDLLRLAGWLAGLGCVGHVGVELLVGCALR